MSDEITELRRVVQRIALKSHVSGAVIGRSAPSGDDDIGGRRPKGGVDGRDDWSPEAEGFALKSADYFQRKLSQLLRRGQRHRLPDLLEEARATLAAWERAPLPNDRPASMADPQWARWVAASKEDAGTLARWYGCTRQHIYATRKKYAA